MAPSPLRFSITWKYGTKAKNARKGKGTGGKDAPSNTPANISVYHSLRLEFLSLITKNFVDSLKPVYPLFSSGKI